MGANAAGSTVATGAACRGLELHSSDCHPSNTECDVDEVELDVWDAASEKTEEVEEEADEERDEAYG
jgi:hypothetical protein